jgi:hypothetical protein
VTDLVGNPADPSLVAAMASLQSTPPAAPPPSRSVSPTVAAASGPAPTNDPAPAVLGTPRALAASSPAAASEALSALPPSPVTATDHNPALPVTDPSQSAAAAASSTSAPALTTSVGGLSVGGLLGSTSSTSSASDALSTDPSLNDGRVLPASDTRPVDASGSSSSSSSSSSATDAKLEKDTDGREGDVSEKDGADAPAAPPSVSTSGEGLEGSGHTTEAVGLDGLIGAPSSAGAVSSDSASGGEDPDDKADGGTEDGAAAAARPKSISLTDSVSVRSGVTLSPIRDEIEAGLREYVVLTTARSSASPLPTTLHIVAVPHYSSVETDKDRLSRLVVQDAANVYGRPETYAERRQAVLDAITIRMAGLDDRDADGSIAELASVRGGHVRERGECRDIGIATLHCMDSTDQVLRLINAAIKVTEVTITALDEKLKRETAPKMKETYSAQIRELKKNIEVYRERRRQALELLEVSYSVPLPPPNLFEALRNRVMGHPTTTVTFSQSSGSIGSSGPVEVPTKASDNLLSRVEAAFNNHVGIVLNGSNEMVMVAKGAGRIVEVRSTSPTASTPTTAAAAASGGGGGGGGGGGASTPTTAVAAPALTASGTAADASGGRAAAAAAAASETDPAAAADPATGPVAATTKPAPTPGADDA